MRWTDNLCKEPFGKDTERHSILRYIVDIISAFSEFRAKSWELRERERDTTHDQVRGTR